MATGFHGFHVLVGTIFLAVCLARVYKGHFTPKQHLGFEFAAWYWHFVDVGLAVPVRRHLCLGLELGCCSRGSRGSLILSQGRPGAALLIPG